MVTAKRLEEAEQYRTSGSFGLLRLRERARENYHAFIESTTKTEKGASVRQESLHRIIHAHIDTCWDYGLHPLILAPFGHGKSVQVAVGRVCWEIGRDPSIRSKIICNNDGKAMERVMGCASLLRSKSYRFIFPDIRKPTKEEIANGAPSKWTQHEIYLSRPGMALDPSIQAAGVLSGGTGGRADLIVFDDIVDQKNAIDEPTLRDKVYENVQNVWMQRLVADGRAVGIATPWHMDDTTHRLMDNPAWSVLRCSISRDFGQIDLEVYNPPPNYPIPRLGSGMKRQEALTDWTYVSSTNILAARYDSARRSMDVTFRSGGAYRYLGVPLAIWDAFLRADSPGRFVSRELRSGYRAERTEPAPVPDEEVGSKALYRSQQEVIEDRVKALLDRGSNGTPIAQV